MSYSKWVKIENDLLNNASIHQLRELLILLSKPINEIENRFDFFFQVSPNRLVEFPVFNQLSSTEQELIRRSIQKAFNSGAKNNPRYFVESGGNMKSDFFRFTLLEATYFFKQNFIIYVENDKNDKYFIKAIAKYFDDSKRIINHIQSGLMSFALGGGIDNFLNTINNKLEEIQEVNYLNKAFPEKYINAFLVCDSDKKHPNQIIQKNVDWINEIQKYGISSHMLEKRSMENYLPDIVFENLANNNVIHCKKWVNVYKIINEDQKNYLKYDVGVEKKTGNVKKLRSEYPQEVQDLYNSISDTNFDILEDGLGLQNYKSTIANLFNSPLIHKKVLVERAGGNEDVNELKTLAHKINEVL